MGRCFTCGKFLAWHKLEAGHHISTAFYGTRYNEKNTNAQCYICNHPMEGNQAVYREKLKEKYGSNIIDELTIQKKLHAKRPFEMEFLAIAAEYKSRCVAIEPQEKQ